jgi:hypothetical protein
MSKVPAVIYPRALSVGAARVVAARTPRHETIAPAGRDGEVTHLLNQEGYGSGRATRTRLATVQGMGSG